MVVRILRRLSVWKKAKWLMVEWLSTANLLESIQSQSSRIHKFLQGKKLCWIVSGIILVCPKSTLGITCLSVQELESLTSTTTKAERVILLREISPHLIQSRRVDILSLCSSLISRRTVISGLISNLRQSAISRALVLNMGSKTMLKSTK